MILCNADLKDRKLSELLQQIFDTSRLDALTLAQTLDNIYNTEPLKFLEIFRLLKKINKNKNMLRLCKDRLTVRIKDYE